MAMGAAGTGASVGSYFRTRRTWDEETLAKLSNHDIIFLNEAKERFDDPGFENLYQKWRAEEINSNAVRTECVKFQRPAQASIMRHAKVQTTLDLYTQEDSDETLAAQGEYLAALGVGGPMVQ
jgi:exonuclease I